MSKRLFIKLGYQVTDFEDTLNGEPIEFSESLAKLVCAPPDWANASDELLRQVADRIINQLQNRDTIYGMLKCLRSKAVND